MELAVPDVATPRSNSRIWSPWMRWAFGVVGPVYCFATALFVLEGDPFFIAPRTPMILFAGCCILAQVVATCRPARGGPPAGFLGGVLAIGAKFALAYAAILAAALPVAFQGTPGGVLVLLPAPAAYVYLRAAIEEFKSGARGGMLRYLLAVSAGIALPFGAGYAGHALAQQIEERVIAGCVDAREFELAQLSSWRAVAWLHDWSQFEELAPGSARAAATFEALTGRVARPARQPL